MKRYLIGILALNLVAASPLLGSSFSHAFEQLEQGMQQMMNEVNHVFQSYASPLHHHKKTLKINNNKDTITLSIAAPHLEKDEIQAERSKNDVIISVQKPELNLNLKIDKNRVEYTIKEEIVKEELDSEDNVISRQSSVSHQSFSQSLPSEVSLEEVSVHYEEGTLSISLPKVQKESEKTRIPITVK